MLTISILGISFLSALFGIGIGFAIGQARCVKRIRRASDDVSGQLAKATKKSWGEGWNQGHAVALQDMVEFCKSWGKTDKTQ